VTFFFLNSLSFCLSLLGFRGLRGIAYLIGYLAFDVFGLRKSIILGNLDIVYGTSLTIKKKKKIGRKSMINFFSTILEFIAAKHLLPKAKFIFKNKECTDKIISRHKGLYAICMHFGNWEYLCHINAKIYSPVNVVVKDVLKGKVELWIKNLRKQLGYKIIDRTLKRSAANQIFDAIDRNEVIGFIVDQKRPNGQFLPFFGKEASTNDSLAKLYFRKEAPMTAATIIRKKPGHFLIEYSQEFIYKRDPSISLAEDISKMSLKLNQFLEPIILKNPEEYYWLHNRWSLEK